MAVCLLLIGSNLRNFICHNGLEAVNNTEVLIYHFRVLVEDNALFLLHLDHLLVQLVLNVFYYSVDSS